MLEKSEGIPEFPPSSNINCYWYPSKNFGDALNPWLITKISQGKLNPNWTKTNPEILAIGSVLGFGLSLNNCSIWGSGIMFKNNRINRPKKVLAVRGPLTAKRLKELGHETTDVFGDPSMLVPLYYPPTNKKYETVYKFGIIPHYCDYEATMSSFSKNSDSEVKIINLLDPIEKVIDDILSCEYFVSSSLHGIIVPQTYGKPTAWIKLSNKVAGDGTKFMDYFHSVDLADQMECHPINNYQIEEMKTIALKYGQTIKPATLKIIQQKLLDCCPFTNFSN